MRLLVEVNTNYYLMFHFLPVVQLIHRLHNLVTSPLLCHYFSGKALIQWLCRALGRRVSDEFAVPLCRTHHRALHRSGDEAAWWKSTNLDPVMIAQRLWQHTRLNGVPIQQDGDRANPSTPPIAPKASDRTSEPDSPPIGRPG